MKNNKTISIVGCGWLGMALGMLLVERGYIVKGSTRTPTKLSLFHKHKITPFIIEVNRKIKGNNLSQFFSSEILFINIPPGRKRKSVARLHPREIAAIIEKAKTYGVKKVIYISSTGVYGNENRVVTEADELRPETQSGLALAQAEALLLEQTDFQTTVLRFGGLVGEDRKAGRFLAGKKDVKNGDAPVNMIHRVDCIGIIMEIIEQECWGELFNACADEHPTKREFYTAQAKKQGFEPPIFSKEPTDGFKEVSNFKVKQRLSYEFVNPNPMDF